MAGLSGLPQGEGPGPSARAVDDAALGSPRARAWTGRRARLPRQAGPGHRVQDPRRAGVKPHKVRYYLERRDPDFQEKMAEVLCVYRQVKILKESAAQSKTEPSDAVAIVSYDEKPGIQAIATTAPDLPSKPGRYATLARDHELKASRHGQLAGRHRSSHRSGPRSRQGPPPRAANSSNSSSSSTPPIPAIRRSS